MQTEIFTIYSINQLKTELIEPLQKDLSQLLKQRPEPETLLTRKQAAKFLNITLVTLNDWSKRKYVESGRIGNRVYYKKSDLIKAIKKGGSNGNV